MKKGIRVGLIGWLCLLLAAVPAQAEGVFAGEFFIRDVAVAMDGET